MEEKVKCWEHLNCTQGNCPVYKSENWRCWLINGTLCGEERRDSPLEKAQLCLDCEIFKRNMDTASIDATCRIFAKQFNQAKNELETRDQELAEISMEMALGLSEVFEALKKIASGDPLVRIDETSDLELIAKLKELVNKTAANMGEIVDLSHEFAMGLAEHFDVMHRVTTGDLAARISSRSKIELLESLKQVTNQTIGSIQQEIANRQEIENNLRKSEERFRTFAEKAPIGITIAGPDRRFKYINPAFIEIFGYTMEDIPDKQTWFEKAYPDDTYRKFVMSMWEKKYAESAKTTEDIVHPTTLAVKCKDGAEKAISFKTVVLKDGTHFVIYADITERERAQAAIRKSEEKYRTLVDNIQDGVFLLGPSKFIFVNDALAQMAGYSADELIGRDFISIIAPEDLEMVIDRHARRQAGEQVEREYEFRLLHKDGSTRVHVNLHIDNLTYQDRKTTIGTLKNITQQKQAEKEKRELEIRLQRSSKMEALGTLAGGVAHDLNNILSGIVSYPELLLMDLPPEEPLRKPIEIIQQSGEKAAAIVQDLLTLARRGVVTRENVDLNHIIEGYLRSPEHDLLNSFHANIRLKTRLNPELLTIAGSPVHLSKTVMNLVSNAAEAMPAGGELSISTANLYVDRTLRGYENVREGEYATLTVADTGTGISPQDVEQIFEPFYTKKVMGRSGTGLGMAVVWGTVKDHQGYIDVQSREGQGTTFKLYFPAARENIAEHGKQVSIEDLKGHGEKLLVVDDVKEQRIIAAAILSKLGYQAATVSSGEEAVAYLREQAADLVILDMIMEPGIDGLDTFLRITELNPGQKAIIASGFSETDRVKAAQRRGAGEYVKKPYTVEKLALAVHHALDK